MKNATKKMLFILFYFYSFNYFNCLIIFNFIITLNFCSQYLFTYINILIFDVATKSDNNEYPCFAFKF